MITNNIPDIVSQLPPKYQPYFNALFALLVFVGAAGRAYYAWKSGGSITKGLVLGDNNPAVDKTAKPVDATKV